MTLTVKELLDDTKKVSKVRALILTEAERESIRERIKKNTTVDKNGCWIWQKHLRNGYGRMYFTRDGLTYGKNAHRWAYMAFFGNISIKLDVDHLCKVPRCANPYHCEAVTHSENVRRSNAICVLNERKTHCVNGHQFDEENTIYLRKTGRKTWRGCRRCGRESKKRKRAARQALSSLSESFKEMK